MQLLTIHRAFHPSPVLLLVAISGIMCVQPTMFPALKSCKAMAASAFLTCTNFETGFKLPEFSGIVVSVRANQYSTKAPSSYWTLIYIVIAVTTGDTHSACHNTSPGIALPTPSRSVDPLHASTGFLCIGTSEICVHHVNSQLEP